MKQIEYPIEKANTGRYLYHLSYKRHRKSIAEFGLNVPKRGAVFAHNTNRLTYDWYYICLDIHEWWFWDYYNKNRPYYFLGDREELKYFVNKFYDIWKIDNHIAKKQWNIDQAGLKDSNPKQRDYYVRCDGSIPPDAIELCTLDLDVKEDEKPDCESNHITYYHPIITYNEFVSKYGCEPEINAIKELEYGIKNELLEIEDMQIKGELNKLKNKYIVLKNAA